MNEKIKRAIEDLQCPGCVCGHNIECFESSNVGCGCGKHVAGTMISPGLITVFLGMPTGFNRLGITPQNPEEKLRIRIFETIKDQRQIWTYDEFNVPVWMHFNNGITFIRGFMPRNNIGFLHVILEDCSKDESLKNAIVISENDIKEMD